MIKVYFYFFREVLVLTRSSSTWCVALFLSSLEAPIGVIWSGHDCYLMLKLAMFGPESRVRELWLVDWTGEREGVGTVALQCGGETRNNIIIYIYLLQLFVHYSVFVYGYLQVFKPINFYLLHLRLVWTEKKCWLHQENKIFENPIFLLRCFDLIKISNQYHRTNVNNICHKVRYFLI